MIRVPVDTVIVRRAARILFREARILHEGHTIDGEWPSTYQAAFDAKRIHDQMVETAKALNAAVTL